jgi:lipopolysaccharide heptosyltransferase II
MREQSAAGYDGVNIKLLKNLDVLIGAMLTRILKEPPSKPVPEIKKILVIRPGGIGDAVLLVPAIRCLKRHYTGSQITVLAEKRNQAVFSMCPDVDRVVLYDWLPELVKTLRCQFDLVIDTEQWHRLSAIVARLTGAPFSIGFATNERKRLFNHPVPYSHDDYEEDSFLNLLMPLIGLSLSEIGYPFLEIPEPARQKAGSLLEPIVGGKGFVVIFPGASIPERRWGTDKFRELAARLHRKDIHIVVVGGSGDEADGNSIVSGNYGLNLAGNTSLAETAAVIEKSVLLISGDSGILHIGVGLGKPTVSLFGPGIAKKWAPRGDKHIVINRNLSCSPCTKFGYTPKCLIGARCLADITADEVFAAIERLLAMK